jgi:hypothetical protein
MRKERIDIDSTPKEGGKRCSHCERVKPCGAFSPKNSWCKTCVRIGITLYRQTEPYRRWLKEYQARPDVRDRMRKENAKYRERIRATTKLWARTATGKLSKARTHARRRLRAATTEKQRAHYIARIKLITAELKRIKNHQPTR